MTPQQLALELEWDPRILKHLTHRAMLITTVRDEVALMAHKWPADVLEKPEACADEISMRWPPGTGNADIAYRLALILLKAYTPEEPA